MRNDILIMSEFEHLLPVLMCLHFTFLFFFLKKGLVLSVHIFGGISFGFFWLFLTDL